MKTTLLRLARFTLWLYYTWLFSWIAAYVLIGDRFSCLGILNLVAVYLFFPLPLGLLAALGSRKPALWLPLCAALLAFLLLWGDLFLPTSNVGSNPSPQLKVMTYNVLAWHNQTTPIIDAIRSQDPDVVFIQELNASLAERLQSELSPQYPFQVLASQDNPRGAGTISKYPLAAVNWSPQHQWISPPQVLELSWHGRTVRLVNFHMHPTTKFASLTALSRDFRRREDQARDLLQLSSPGIPLILGGDANAAPLNQAYKILASTYRDAWQEAGFGLGHTFPTSYIAPGLERNRAAGFEIPALIVRIDHLFYSQHWEVQATWLGPRDGVSDHRSILALLSLRD